MQDFDSFMPFVAIALIATTTVASIVLGVGYGKKKAAKVRRLAEALGLEFVEGRAAAGAALDTAEGERVRAALEKMPTFLRSLMDKAAGYRAQGELGGVKVAVWVETRSSGKSASTWTVARAYPPSPLRFALRLSREGTMVKIGKSVLGLKDLELGDGDFDPKVRVKTDDPVQARLLLDHEARKAVLELLEGHPNAVVKSDAVTWERMGLHLDPDKLRRVLESLAKVAAALGR